MSSRSSSQFPNQASPHIPNFLYIMFPPYHFQLWHNSVIAKECPRSNTISDHCYASTYPQTRYQSSTSSSTYESKALPFSLPSYTKKSSPLRISPDPDLSTRQFRIKVLLSAPVNFRTQGTLVTSVTTRHSRDAYFYLFICCLSCQLNNALDKFLLIRRITFTKPLKFRQNDIQSLLILQHLVSPILAPKAFPAFPSYA